jgi:hypothetical protein
LIFYAIFFYAFIQNLRLGVGLLGVRKNKLKNAPLGSSKTSPVVVAAWAGVGPRAAVLVALDCWNSLEPPQQQLL